VHLSTGDLWLTGDAWRIEVGHPVFGADWLRSSCWTGALRVTPGPEITKSTL